MLYDTERRGFVMQTKGRDEVNHQFFDDQVFFCQQLIDNCCTRPDFHIKLLEEDILDSVKLLTGNQDVIANDSRIPFFLHITRPF